MFDDLTDAELFIFLGSAVVAVCFSFVLFLFHLYTLRKTHDHGRPKR